MLSEIVRLRYTEATQIYKEDLVRYKEFKTGISSVMALITQTTGNTAKPFIRNMGSEDIKLQQILKDMKDRFSLEEKDRIRLLRKRYKALGSTPKSSEIDKWITDWESVYMDCKKADLPEAKGTVAAEDFIQAVKPLSEEFYNHWNPLIRNQDTYNLEISFFKVVQSFRADKEEKGLSSSRGTDAAFGTFRGQKELTDKDSHQKKSSRTSFPKCVCGRNHRYSQCWHLIESIRPEGWKPSESIKRKIEDMLQGDEKLQQVVKKVQLEAQSKSKKDSRQESESTNATQEVGWVMALQIQKPIIKPAYTPLRNCYVLDSASTINVCNDLSRFINTTDAEEGTGVYAGDTFVKTMKIGRIIFWPTDMNGKRFKVILTNVHYIPRFHTNIVSYDRLEEHGIYWDMRRNYLVHGNNDFC